MSAVGGAGTAEGGDAFEIRDKAVLFASYEDYLDSQVTEQDMFYLEDEDLARQLIGESSSCSRQAWREQGCPQLRMGSRTQHPLLHRRGRGCVLTAHWALSACLPGRPRAFLQSWGTAAPATC